MATEKNPFERISEEITNVVKMPTPEEMMEGAPTFEMEDDGGVTVIDDDQKRKIIMSSLDTALVSIGMASPVPTPLVVPNVQDGVHFPLVGNIWNTNYPFWYPFDANDKSSQFRFQYQFS